jgi:hypothetical protein
VGADDQQVGMETFRSVRHRPASRALRDFCPDLASASLHRAIGQGRELVPSHAAHARRQVAVGAKNIAQQ